MITQNYYILGAFVVLLLFGFGVLASRMKKIIQDSRSAITSRYPVEEIIHHNNQAHYLGSEAANPKEKPIQGKGVLILSTKELFFFSAMPKIELIIPVRRIKRCTTVSTFKGKTSKNPLLKIDFKANGGNIDSATWLLEDLSNFERAIRNQRKQVEGKKKK